MKLLPKSMVDLSWLGCFTEYVLKQGMPADNLTGLFLALCEDDIWYEKNKSKLPADVVVLGPAVTRWCKSVLGSCDPQQTGDDHWQIKPALAKKVLMTGLKTYYEGAEQALRQHGVEVEHQQEKSSSWLINTITPRNTNWRMQ